MIPFDVSTTTVIIVMVVVVVVTIVVVVVIVVVTVAIFNPINLWFSLILQSHPTHTVAISMLEFCFTSSVSLTFTCLVGIRRFDAIHLKQANSEKVTKIVLKNYKTEKENDLGTILRK